MSSTGLSHDTSETMPSKHITIWTDTRHGLHRRLERQISEKSIWETVLNPDSQQLQRRGGHGGNVWKFEKQYGTRRLRVIAELHKETCYILTSFWI
jgi:hypothetical protein